MRKPRYVTTADGEVYVQNEYALRCARNARWFMLIVVIIGLSFGLFVGFVCGVSVAARADELPHETEGLAVAESVWLHREELAAHENDVETFRARFRRWGDFLEIETERHGERLAGAVRLDRTRGLVVIPGRAPDEDGDVNYSAQQMDGLCAQDVGCSPRVGWSLPPRRISWPTLTFGETVSQYPATLSIGSNSGTSMTAFGTSAVTSGTSMTMFETTAGTSGRFCVVEPTQAWVSVGTEQLSDSRVGIHTAGVARDAVDDRIEFPGANATLSVPAGFGTRVRDEILTAIATGEKP